MTALQLSTGNLISMAGWFLKMYVVPMNVACSSGQFCAALWENSQHRVALVVCSPSPNECGLLIWKFLCCTLSACL